MIFAVGHGGRAYGELTGLLREAGIECLVDVRAYPASRRRPQFARETTASSRAGSACSISSARGRRASTR
jgi:uncharacterized protein (DUF488 family)